jgi:DNA-binding MarR family transcriptional regulator
LFFAIGNWFGVKLAGPGTLRLRSQYAGQPTSNAEIAKELKLSRPTVSRIVDDFVRWGWVVERVHPDDGRKRQLVIAPGHRREDEFEKFFRVILNDLIARYGNGELVVVDAEKKSF